MEAIAARAAVVRGGEDRASNTSSTLDRKQRFFASAAEILHTFATTCNTEKLTHTPQLSTFAPSLLPYPKTFTLFPVYHLF